jgi:vacuolar-type H+-ATPase subunit I/STV1
MLKNVLAIVAGYFAMAFAVFLSFTVLYLAIGADGAFEPGTYQVSMLWIVVSTVLSFAAAFIGGTVCARIATVDRAPVALAAIVLGLGLVMALPALNPADDTRPTVRTEAVGNLDAMTNARQPTWIAFANPLIGAVGVMAGARRRAGR